MDSDSNQQDQLPGPETWGQWFQRNKWIILIVALAIAALAWYLYSKKSQTNIEVINAPAPTTPSSSTGGRVTISRHRIY